MFLILSHNELSIVHFLFFIHPQKSKVLLDVENTHLYKLFNTHYLIFLIFLFHMFFFWVQEFSFLFGPPRNLFVNISFLLSCHFLGFPCVKIFKISHVSIFPNWKSDKCPCSIKSMKNYDCLHACNVLAAEQMKKFKVSLDTWVGKPPDYQYKKKIKQGQSSQLTMEILKRIGSTGAWNSCAWEINDRRLWIEAMLGCILTLHLRGE